MYYNLGQACITNSGKHCLKFGQLHYYKSGQVLLQIGTGITNQGNYYKLWHHKYTENIFYSLSKAITIEIWSIIKKIIKTRFKKLTRPKGQGFVEQTRTVITQLGVIRE